MALPEAVQRHYGQAAQHCQELRDAALRRGDIDGVGLALGLLQVLATVHRWNEEVVAGANPGVLRVDRATSDILSALMEGLSAA
jgi:hypothetical protein